MTYMSIIYLICILYKYVCREYSESTYVHKIIKKGKKKL